MEPDALVPPPAVPLATVHDQLCRHPAQHAGPRAPAGALTLGCGPSGGHRAAADLPARERGRHTGYTDTDMDLYDRYGYIQPLPQEG